MLGVSRSFFTRATPLTWLLAINIAAYVGSVLVAFGFYLADSLALFERLYRKLALPGSPELFLRQPWSLITHMFIHDWRNFWHILMNMLWLYWIGQIFVTTQVPTRLYWVYGLGGLGGALGFLAYAWSHQAASMHALGASAAVNGVLFATAALHPNMPISLILIGPIALRWVALIWIFLDLILTLNGNEASAIAHLCGAGMGLILGYGLRQGWQPERLGDFFAFRLQQEEVTPEVVDKILEKIHRKGLRSLSRREREILRRAAEKL
ncbi:MAG: rhomboid family intramembrane serine protease [Bacteroidia bacterium]